MADTFLVVESPAKAKAISKYLGKGFTVKASMGHIRDLPAKKIAVDPKKNFEPTFVVLPAKKATAKELLSIAQKSKTILLAADPDREGEAICYHLGEILKEADKPIKRVLFYEITEKAVKEAVNNPIEIDPHKVEAQIARRLVDRLVGYYISPLLWEKVKHGLSAGRVQTVALRMLVEREAEIEAFVPVEYWVIGALLQGSEDKPFEAKLTHFKGGKAEIGNSAANDEIRKHLDGKPWRVLSLIQKEQKKSPLPPFTTSKLQQEASRLLRFPVKKAMMVAQKLYEGIDLAGGETVGLITYMRTDSTRISPAALESARKFIGHEYGKELVPEKPKVYSPKKGAQDAHEAIRPTDVTKTPESIREYLGADEFALYKLIWRRFVASQMTDAVFHNTKAQIECSDAVFQAQGSICTFKGFRVLYDQPDNEEDKSLPHMKKGDELKLVELKSEQKFTEPPSRYSEATLVKALEENGIGRPSTYAAIISTIQDRDYVKKEAGYLVPGGLGRMVADILVKHFPTLFDVKYTASLEEELDKVESGDEARLTLLKRFWKLFEETLEQAKKEMHNVKKEGLPTDEKCPACGKPMVIKIGPFGTFLACSDYPKCKKTRPLPQEEKPLNVPESEMKCEVCGASMIVKRGRFGAFLACEHYPKCKGKKNLMETKEGELVIKKEELLDEKCPDCGSQLVKRKGRFGPFVSCSNYPACKFIQGKKQDENLPPCPLCGKAMRKLYTKRKKPFYGCTGYPKCNFLSWNEVIAEPCPKCASPYLVKKVLKKGTFKVCAKEGCGYEISME